MGHYSLLQVSVSYKTYMAEKPATTKNESPLIPADWGDFHIKKYGTRGRCWGVSKLCGY